MPHNVPPLNYPARKSNHYSLSAPPKLRHSLSLFLLTLANYGLMYAANILLARELDVEAFDDYSVAVSVVTMMSTFATLGLEKYALRAIALFRERQDWPAYRGYWLFSLLTIAGLSLFLIVLIGIALELMRTHTLYDTGLHIAIILYSCYLPFITVSLFLVEILAVHGAFLISVSIYRFFLPAVYLLALTLLLASPITPSAEAAVICLGTSWTLAFLILWAINRAITPVDARLSPPEFRIKKWLSRSLPLVMSSLMMSVMTSGGVVIMELIRPSGLEVGLYAVAAQTGGFISLIGTSTNRYFLPMIVVMMERRDAYGLRTIILKKSAIVGGLLLALLAVIFLYGDAILNLFGDQFVQGYLTLAIIATGASFSALFADVPYYLQFMGQHRLVLRSMLLAVLSMWVISFILGPEHGPVGVAIAYALPVIVLFSSLRIVAAMHLKWMQDSKAR
ncbi:MAG: lipopolysaccharide biosynthesis protein [Gammaproteobacteria bacterium]